MDIEAKIQDIVESVAIVFTFMTRHAGSQASTKNFVDPGGFGEFWINISMGIYKRLCGLKERDITVSVQLGTISAGHRWHSEGIHVNPLVYLDAYAWQWLQSVTI